MAQPVLFSPLQPQLREIRVLHILPSERFDDEIRCELEVVSLDINPEYEALSYVWSTPPGTTFITVHGQPLEVTVNLAAALRRLRCVRKTRILWADAICINQADMDERSAQVLLMGDVYRLTKKVLIWLGDSLDGTPEDTFTVDERANFPWRDATFDASVILEPQLPGLMRGDDEHWDYIFRDAPHIPHINEKKVLKWEDPQASKLHTPGYAAFAMLYLLSSSVHLPKLPCFTAMGVANKRYEAAFTALSVLLGLSWWKRIWVVQEAILPPQATVILGSVHAPWEMFIKAAHTLETHTATCCAYIRIRLKTGVTLLIDTLIHNIYEIGWERERLKKHGSLRATFDLLRQYRCREATDPRDKIYGMLGVAPGLKRIAPDYRRTTSEVYRDVAINIMEESQLLCVLEGPRPSTPTSWIPDWAYTIDARQWMHERTRLRQNSQYNVSKDKKLNVQLNPDDNSLTLRGIYIDTVSEVSPLVSAYESSKTLCHHIQKWAYMVDLFRNGGIPYHAGQAAGEQRWRAFFRTITRDMSIGMDGEQRRSLPSDDYVFVARWWLRQDTQKVFREEIGDDPHPSSWVLRALRYIVSLLPGSPDRDPELPESVLNMFFRSVGTATAGHAFFVTKEGYYGLGNAQPGDCVFLLYGGACPFLLRARGQLVSTLQLIGDCYLHGIMDGEAVDRWECREREVVLV